MSETAKEFNPFPGLRPFDTDEYDLFFGREGQSEELLARLGETRFLAVVGTSGSGKSSLIKAGLLPALRGGMMRGAGSAWRIAVMRPGSDPVGNLARTLAEDGVLKEAGGGFSGEEAEAVIEATLRRGALGLVAAVRQANLAAHENVLVVADQFEELFRFRDKRGPEDSGAAFVKLLLEAAQQRELPVYVVLTMRSDFLGDCSQFQGLPEAINRGQYLIPRMTRDERRIAITGPAAVARGRIDELLVNRLLNDVGDNPDQLPILQHALMRTWEHWLGRRRDGEPVGVEDYEAVGTMSDALSQHANEAFNELPDDRSRRVAEILFKALTERGTDNRETRKPTRLLEICEVAGASEDEVRAVVEVFRKPGRSFLMPPAGTPLTPDTVIDISHESLIRVWELLRKWAGEEAESARMFRRLADSAALGNRLTGPALDAALEWRERHRPNAAWAERYRSQFGLQTTFEEVNALLDESKAHRDALAAEEKRRVEQERERERRDLEQAQLLAEEKQRAAELEQRRAESERQRALEQAAAKERELVQARDRAAEQDKARRRQRRLLWVLAALLVLAVGAAVLAFTQSVRAMSALRLASAEQERANKSARDATEQYKKAEDARVEAEKAKGEAESAKDKAEKAEDEALDAKQRAEAEAERANEQERIAKEEAANAARNAARLQRENQFATDSSAASASLRRGELAEAQHQLLTLAGDFKDDPRKLSWVYTNMGAAWHRQGNLVESEKAYRSAKMTYERMIAAGTPPGGKKYALSDIEYLDILNGLARLYDDYGKYEQAEPLYKYALEINEKALGKEHPETASGLEALAANYNSQGKPDAAEPLYERALEIRRKTPESPELIEALNKAAGFYSGASNPREALKLYKELLAIQENRLTGDDPKMADIYSDLARAYRDTESYGSEEVAKRLDALAQQIRSRNRNSTYYTELAKKYIGVRKYRQADPLVSEAEKLYKPEDMASASEAAAPYIEFAQLHREAGGFKNAEDSYNQVINDITLGDGETKRRALEGLASLYYDSGSYDDAVKLYERAAAMYPPEAERNDRNRVDAATTLVRLALAHTGKGDFAAAERRLNDALREATAGRSARCSGGRASTFPVTHWCMRPYIFGIIVNTYLADLYRRQGKTDEADALYKKAREEADYTPPGTRADVNHPLRPGTIDYLGDNHPEIIPAFIEAARFSLKRHGDAAAEPFYYMATVSASRKPDRYVSATVAPVIEAYGEYADLLERTGRADSAEAKRQNANSLLSVVKSNENPLPEP